VFFNAEFNVTIPSYTMNEILKTENILKLQQAVIVEDLNKRINNAKYPELETCLYL